MAHDFLGTYNTSQLQRFISFAQAQLVDVTARVTHLTAEINRVGSIVMTYDSGGTPKTYEASPNDSYLGRLLAVYEILGGDAFYDLNLRSREQPVYLIKGDETTTPQMMSNGEVVGLPGQADAPTAVIMQSMKAWLLETFDYKRDYLEHKIRRTVDYSDQLQDEISMLNTIVAAKGTGCLTDLVTQAQAYLSDKMYTAVYDDAGKDPFGKLVNAPVLPYTPGKDGLPEAESYGKVPGGVLKPGETT